MIERICEYNGQTVTVSSETYQPVSDHDCGHEDCPLRKIIRSERIRELNFEREDWGAVAEWSDMYDD